MGVVDSRYNSLIFFTILGSVLLKPDSYNHISSLSTANNCDTSELSVRAIHFFFVLIQDRFQQYRVFCVVSSNAVLVGYTAGGETFY